MDAAVPVLIGALGALGGSALTGYIAMRIFRLQRHERDTAELRAALAAYGLAVDRIGLQIDQLPRVEAPFAAFFRRQLARWPELDWLIGRASIATVGRGGMLAIDGLMAATNRLMLIAPQPVIASAEEIFGLIERFVDPGDDAWKADWHQARARLAAVSRHAATPDRQP